METKWRVAAASLEGSYINEHFGRATHFYMYDIGKDGTVQFIEKRSVPPSGDSAGHSDIAILAKISVLSDCAAVLVSQIGPGAKRILDLNKITALEKSGDLNATLQALAEYFVKTKFKPLPGR